MVTRATKRALFVTLGVIAVLLGAIGALLPVMPTVPFLILAAYFFSKGSVRAHQWLLNLPKVGKMIEDWENNRTISRNSKVMASLGISALILSSCFFVPSAELAVMLILIGIAVGVFIWTRPEPPKPSH
jgi:uncharacterized membrane protein YbaN (DUF454 family)